MVIGDETLGELLPGNLSPLPVNLDAVGLCLEMVAYGV
jgi:hypothetical protein